MFASTALQWDMTSEIIIIGYGLAGAVTAITASDKRAKVLILEKQNADSHYSNSSMSSGLILCPTSIDAAIKYLHALCKVTDKSLHWTDLDTIRAWAEYSVQNKRWLENIGGKLRFRDKHAEYAQFPGADCMERWEYPGRGFRMMQFMYKQVSQREIEVLYRTAAQRLINDQNGRIIGVQAIDKRNEHAKILNIKALKAVVICSGGFENNEDMKLQYLRLYPIYFSGSIENTGDGIKMAQEIGADLWHMNCISARLVAKFPDFPMSFLISLDYFDRQKDVPPGNQRARERHGFILVDRYGRRYMSEHLKRHAASYELTGFDTRKLEYPKIPSYFIFDQRRMESRPLCQLSSGAAGPHQFYRWSHNNMAELEKGWIISAKTVDELAGKIGMSPSILTNTVQSWNKYCAEKNDVEFSRNPGELVPLDQPPFYSIKLFPGGPNTQGGPRRNMKAQVLNPFGDSIPGLYAAGECGSIFGMLYPSGGSNLSECIAFGRIAADNAVLEP